MKALIIGSGLSGQSAYDYLIKNGFEVEYAKSEDINSGENLKNMEYQDRLFSGLSFIVTSPGISLDLPIIKLAMKKKIKIIGEFELGTYKIKSNIISVTGTNGKTTTVSLINFILKDYNQNIFLGGNIGVPVTSFCDKVKKNDVVILECSSYQLETTKKFHSHISAILNITPDHLNRHKTMENYVKCKQKITKNQTDKDFLLINADDDFLMQNIPKTKAKIYYFSTKNKVQGCYIKRGSIYFNDNLSEKRLVSLSGIKLLGEHNKSNILCACLAVYLQTGDEKLLKNIKDFYGVEHRIEYVKTHEGIAFYNDSKATNIQSTLVATSSFKQKINLILGGSDKGYSFDELFENLPKNVKNIAVCGDTKQKILDSAKKFKYKNIFVCDSLKSSVKLLYDKALPNEIILLSPACASFDFFKNYEERGCVFKKIVKEMTENEITLFEHKKEIEI